MATRGLLTEGSMASNPTEEGMASDLSDDPTIDGELWRRILPRAGKTQDWYKQDDGEWRPTSVAFLDNRGSTHSLSAYIASETHLDRLRQDYPNDNIAGFPAGIPREHGHTIQRVPDRGYNSHVEITPPIEMWGMESRKIKRRKEAARAMAKAAQWVYYADPLGSGEPPPEA
jgi:hypothetical protein